MGNQYTSEEDKIESLRQTVRKHIPGWELVSKDGSKVTIKNTMCHHERTIFYGTMFHMSEGFKCKECARAEAKRKHETEKEQRRISDAEDRFQRMKENLRRHYPEFEYVSGFTNCNSKVIVRAKCGHEREISLISVRHDNVDPECKECARIKREKEQEKEREKKHKLVEYERSMKPAKYKQIGFSECPVCGAFYFASKNRYCSQECSKTINNQRQNRRKDFRKRISKTDESKDITLLSVYKKDNGICWICGKPCDYTLDGNDNYYPSIDHVIPIAKGGKDCWDNVRLAHRGCNIVKSDHLFTSPRSV